RVHHVVDQHDDPAVDADRDVGRADGARVAQAQVVAVEGDVEGAHGRVDALGVVDDGGDAAGQGDTAGVQPDQHDVLGATVALEDLVGEADDGAAQVEGRHDLCLRGERAGAAHGWPRTFGLLSRLTGRGLKGRLTLVDSIAETWTRHWWHSARAWD